MGTPPHTAGVWDDISTLAGSSALSSLDRFTDNVATPCDDLVKHAGQQRGRQHGTVQKTLKYCRSSSTG